MARLVQPIEYNRVESLVCGYYSYFSGIDMDGVEIYFAPGAASLFFPTNDGRACIVAGRPHSYFDDFRRDLEDSYWKTLDAIGHGVAERVRAGKREERFSGSGDLPHFFRKPYGPGWALVGDAGLHIDPMQGLGISKAFSEVDMLVPALIQGLSGERPMDEALADYHNQRDETWVPFTRENIAASSGLSAENAPPIIPWSETPYAREGVPA
jgi:flavin-dependent dehydrogenase